MPCSCSPKAKAIQSHVRKQNNCPSFGNTGTSSRIPTEQASFVLIYTVSIKHELQTADCRLRTVDCGLRTAHYELGIKHGLGYKTRTAD